MVQELKGADMDIDLLSNPKVSWDKEKSPWNEAEGKEVHKCAVKGVSICKYFQGIERPDTVLCSYGEKE
jgi:hypothetical protein